jgi:hypothetical protein
VMFEGTARPHDDWSVLVLEGAHRSAIGTGLLGAEMAGLFLGCDLESTCQQGTHRRDGDVFHFAEGHIQSRSLLSPVLPDDDFSPASRQFLDVGEILRCQFLCVHAASLQQDGSLRLGEILP